MTRVNARGTTSFVLTKKLQGLKSKLKLWNKGCFGMLETNKKRVLDQVKEWDRIEEERGLSLAEGGAIKEAKEDFKRWVLLEEKYWRQKYRELWLREGDKNIGFFNRMANAHFSHNSSTRIKINGGWLIKDQEIREGVVNAFHFFLADELEWRVEIDGLPFEVLNHEEANSLEVPFREEEICGALFDINGDKALGAGGFTLTFWQASWDVVKEDVLKLFSEFFDLGTFTRSLNATFMVLIPRKGEAEELGYFKPISLVGNLYKLLAKVLANRLRKVVGESCLKGLECLCGGSPNN